MWNTTVASYLKSVCCEFRNYGIKIFETETEWPVDLLTCLNKYSHRISSCYLAYEIILQCDNQIEILTKNNLFGFAAGIASYRIGQSADFLSSLVRLTRNYNYFPTSNNMALFR